MKVSPNDIIAFSSTFSVTKTNFKYLYVISFKISSKNIYIIFEGHIIEKSYSKSATNQC